MCGGKRRKKRKRKKKRRKKKKKEEKEEKIKHDKTNEKQKRGVPTRGPERNGAHQKRSHSAAEVQAALAVAAPGHGQRHRQRYQQVHPGLPLSIQRSGRPKTQQRLPRDPRLLSAQFRDCHKFTTPIHSQQNTAQCSCTPSISDLSSAT
jgi:hypothetical protein